MLVPSIAFPAVMMKSTLCDERPLHERRDTHIQFLDLTKPKSLDGQLMPFYFPQPFSRPSQRYSPAEGVPESPDSTGIPASMPSAAYHRSHSDDFECEDRPLNLSTTSDSIPATVFTTARTTTTPNTLHVDTADQADRQSVDSSRSTESPPKTPNTPSCYKKQMLKRYGKILNNYC